MIRKKLILLLSIFLLAIGSLGVYLNYNYTTPIFMYHSLDVNRLEEYAVVDPEVFRQQMEFLEKGRYKVISLEKYCRAVKDGRPLSKKTVVITFDDGHKDNLKAIEILKEYDYPATIFLIVDNIGKEGYLSYDDIRRFLSDTQVTIGSHTLSHAYLPDLNRGEIETEIYQSRLDLTDKFTKDVDTVSYPIGGFNKETLEIVKKAGYLCACATNRGFSKKLNRFALRRIKITNNDLGIRFWAKASGLYNIFRRPKDPF